MRKGVMMMAQIEDIKALYKAINNLHKVLNDQSQKIDNYLNGRCDTNQQEISDNSDAIIEVSEDVDIRIGELDDALIETTESTDERITELEDAMIEIANSLAE